MAPVEQAAADLAAEQAATAAAAATAEAADTAEANLRTVEGDLKLRVSTAVDQLQKKLDDLTVRATAERQPFKIQIEKFSGPTDSYHIDHFINKVDTAASYNKWDDATTANAAFMAMSGTAYTYVYGMQQSDLAVTVSWALLKEVIRTRFQRTHNAAEISRLLSDNKQRSKESVDDFIMRVEQTHRIVYKSFGQVDGDRLAERKFTMDQAIKVAFTSGLLPQLKEKVENQLTLDTKEDVLRAAQQAELACRTSHEYSVGSISSSKQESTIETLKAELAAIRGGNFRRGGNRSGGGGYRGGRGRGNFRGSSGSSGASSSGSSGGGRYHAAQSSGYGWNSRGAQRGGSGSSGSFQSRNSKMNNKNMIFCYNCKQWGHHYANTCRKGNNIAMMEVNPALSDPDHPPPFEVLPEQWETELTHYKNSAEDSNEKEEDHTNMFTLNI